MAVAFWLGRFLSNLQWNLANASKRERRYAKMQRRARRKQDGLASQLEDLEYRVMLSGTTAVNDQAVLKQINTPITLNVLANDYSANGKLEITNASLLVGSGSVRVVQGNPLETGLAGQDQIEVTLANNFSGSASVQYSVVDEAGNQSTASASINMSADPGIGFYQSGANGALIVVGGTGGGHSVSPTSGFIPTITGNMSFTIGVLGASFSTSEASGDQDIVAVVTTTSDGVANWSYTEQVVWDYDIDSQSGDGDSKHYWGGYSYAFSAVSVDGVITTTFAYVAGDEFDVTSVTTTPAVSYTSRSRGSVDTVITVVNIDAVFDFGSVYYRKTDSANSTGHGIYNRSLYGGGIVGSMSSSGSSNNQLTLSRSYAQLTTGGFHVTGSVAMSGDSDSNYSYSGSGSYDDHGVFTTANESGGQTESSQYSGGGAFDTLIGWTLSGSGHMEGTQESRYSYDGVRDYEREFHGGIIEGVQLTSGYNNSSGDFRIDYNLTPNGWKLSGGVNSGGGESLSKSQYVGGGDYEFVEQKEGYSKTLSGLMAESGKKANYSYYQTSGTLDIATSKWNTSGSGNALGSNEDELSYSGSGSYYRLANNGLVSGDASESFYQKSSGNFKNMVRRPSSMIGKRNRP